MPITHHYLNVQNIRLHYVQAKPETSTTPLKTLIFLHGFPEYWGSWLAQIEYFYAQYRVIVPDLMGYNLSDKPTDLEVFRLPKLIELYADFVRKIAPSEQVTLIAHDWGGAIAWPLAAFHAQLFSQLVILNAAHPSTFTREMLHNPKQRQKSAYIQQLISCDAVEVVSKDNFAMLRDMLFNGMIDQQFTALQQAQYLRAWGQPGAIEGMLNYYRVMPSLPSLLRGEATDQHQRDKVSAQKIPNIRINLPTLILWGEQDEAFTQDILTGIEQYVPDCLIHRYPDASHWLHHEQPKSVNRQIASFIQVKLKV